MRRIAVVTVARSDYGILLPVLREIQRAPDLQLQLVAGGAHLSRNFGDTIGAIERDGFEIAARVETLLASDSPTGIASSVGLGVLGFAGAYARLSPDLLLLTGDRFDMLAAAAAALPFTMPIAHLHGGEQSEGAIDNQIRHAITKMSHLHFVATPTGARRVVQMGEEPWRVTVTGAPALDNLRAMPLLPIAELERLVGIELRPAPLLVTYHPVTLEYEETATQTAELIAALADVERPIVITYPNADTHHRDILHAIRGFAAGRPGVALVENLGTQAYFSLMACAAAMVGNSSSGIIEAPSFRLPTVNIGSRQTGRERAANVLDVPAGREAIRAGIRMALSPAFAESLRDLENPYGDGRAAGRIVRVLRERPLDHELRRKRFHAAADNSYVDAAAVENQQLV